MKKSPIELAEAMNLKKYRSPLREMDIALLRLLCDLHPWKLGALCSHVGLGQSTLSSVFAGRRPLPSVVAKKFLDLVGMQPNGLLDPRHCYIFLQRPGHEDELRTLLKRMFPYGSMFMELLPDPGKARAFFDGQYAAVLFAAAGQRPWTWTASPTFVEVPCPGDVDELLNLDLLLTKADVERAFRFERFAPDVSWTEIRAASEARGLEPHEVLQLIESGVQQLVGR